MTEPHFRLASPDDAPALLVLQSSYYREDGYPFNREAASKAWGDFLSDPHLGRAWAAETESELVAYAVLTLGYSLEYRGRDAFLDELYVTPEWRGRGLGRRALHLVDAACVELGVKALHLEVERAKTGTQALYRQWGFQDNDRFLMTKLTRVRVLGRPRSAADEG